MNYLIVTAGGEGQRMKLKDNKIFADLNNKPLIYWTLKIFEDSQIINKIIISARKDDIKKINTIIKKHQFKKILTIFEADNLRQESTFKVLKWLKSKTGKNDLIGIHNAVNPFVSDKEIVDVYQAAKKYRASLLAYLAKDTVKISNEKNMVEFTPLRKFSWYAQTPQVVNFADLWEAFIKAEKENFIGTDDTQLLERIGIKAKIVPCSHLNFKITYPEDLVLANEVLKVFFT
jgi:2-C-methyl-D-erythritol 4-phosphate cytidylyltransferase